MPSARRVRFLVMVGMAVIVTTLFFTSKFGSDESRAFQDFYGKTVNAMERKRGSGGAQIIMDGKGATAVSEAKDKDGDGSVGEDDVQQAKEMAERLRAAEQRAKDQANAKAPLKPDAPSEVVGVGSSAGGQNRKLKDKEASADAKDESDPASKAEAALNELLRKSPVVVFSKSYCPYSKRAKGVLLEKYTIDPAPYIVELDEHPMGKELQAKLGEMTGRSTVPNIMVNGKSIGGSDEINELDARKTLIDKIKSMGNKRVSMKERFGKNGPKGGDQ
ncbi:Monothiol glutaredoxin-7 [Apiospora aurea]|uniref:Monothiol glutaredoxin-7 n=1 Tax=Apiospora aurea TaxID=335848 RepID=A0ABR1QBT8_9PEZI